MTSGANPLLSDRNVAFLMREVVDTKGLLALPAFADHTLETCEMYVQTARKLARDVLYPAYKPMDEAPPRLVDGQLRVHAVMRDIYPRLVELGVITATRPAAVGGASLPTCIATLANVYLMAANLSAYGYAGLTTGAARLLESFGSDDLRARFMTPMYAGAWTGTMALTEPQAGSSLTDVKTIARPMNGTDHYLVRGSKIFISAGDHDLTENIVHLTLARIEGAPAGIKGVSLFAIPKRRGADGGKAGELVANDVHVAGVIHKIGWRGIASLAINFGEQDDCRGWLVGEPHRGISYMFQMMNEARIMVGLNGVATAAVAYQESLEYAKTRPQGRPFGAKNPEAPQVAIIEHADVRRMLLRQKAIVEGGLCLVVETARLQDLSEHAVAPEERERARLLLDLLTPIAKTFPAEKGFESNALAVQIHGGYGYTSEYMPEAWLRDQKLNTLHEGTSGIQSLDLLGRKVMAGGGMALRALALAIQATVDRAKTAGVPDAWLTRLSGSFTAVGEVTMQLGELGAKGDIEAMMRHSFDYMEMLSIVVVGWQWIEQAAAAKQGLARDPSPHDRDFYEGKLAATQYWVNNELPRVGTLGALCRSNEDSYAKARAEWF
jgi:alkylation response protein AidB-like acyl-CoA dehydrogenase